MIREINQFIPVFGRADAIGNHTLAVRAELRRQGFWSEIFAEHIVDESAGVHHVSELDFLDPRQRLVYQLGAATNYLDNLLAVPGPLVVNYHNITPAHFFAEWDADAHVSLTRAHDQAVAIASAASFTIADSGFNASEFARLGACRVSVSAPVPQALPPIPQNADQPRSLDAAPRLLFVGRLAPNKAQHMLIAALAELRTREPLATLRLIGATGSDRYRQALVGLAEHLGVADAVAFRSGLSEAELADEYAKATVFVCASRHEGFCVPILEAMRYQLPIIAVRSSAVTETVSDAGILLDIHDPGQLAQAVSRLPSDGELDRRLSIASSRADSYFSVQTSSDFVEVLRRGLGIAA